MAREKLPTLSAPSRLDYVHTAGTHLSRFLRAIGEKRILGSRCPACTKVYVPLRGTCPTCGVAMGEDVPLPETGTVTTFCVVNVPFEGQVIPPPYACAHVRLDGADVSLFQLVAGCPVEDVHVGMRVRARWVEDAALTPSLDSIRWFEPFTADPVGPS